MERYFEINESGHNIRCKLCCREIRSIRRVVLFCHGFGGHKDNASAARFAEWLTSKYKDAALVTFNLPCHGDDVKKKLALEDCLTYLDLVTGYLRDTYGDDLYGYATSFGGYLTLLHISRKGSPFRRIVLRSPALNMHEALTNAIITEENRQLLAKGREAMVGFDRKIPVTAAFLEEVEKEDVRKFDYLDWAEDMLLLHGTKDEIIPYRESEAFSENQLVDLIPIEGADHRCRDPKKMDFAIKHILGFFFDKTM